MADVKSNDVEKWAVAEKYPSNARVSTVKQVITATTGIKMTFKGVKTETIEQGAFTHFELEDGRLILVNTPNVFTVEVIK